MNHQTTPRAYDAAYVQWGKNINQRRKLEKAERQWSGWLDDELKKLPVLSSGWDGSDKDRAARLPLTRHLYDKVNGLRDQIQQLTNEIKAYHAD